MQLRTGLVAGLVLVLAVAATGCGDATTPASGDGTMTASGEDLEGRTYTSTEVRGFELVEGTLVTLSFAGGQLGASAGCNAMSGAARWHEGRLDVAGQLATTMIACPADLQAKDEWLAELLTSSPSMSLDGSTLTIGGDPGLTRGSPWSRLPTCRWRAPGGRLGAWWKATWSAPCRPTWARS